MQNTVLKLPEGLRGDLRKPLGLLLKDTKDVLEILRKKRPTRLITVGDIVTSSLLEAGVKPDITVTDSIAMRSPTKKHVREPIGRFRGCEVRVKNPAGTIVPELWEVFEKLTPPLKVIVEGEEDLTTLPAVLSSPVGSVVIYGQPHEGLVLVEVTEQKKREFRGYLDRFEMVRSR